MTADAVALFLRSRWIAARARIARLRGGDFHTYPKAPPGLCLDPSEQVQEIASRTRPVFDFASVDAVDVKAWQQDARARLRKLLLLPDQIDLPSVVEEREMPVSPGFARRRLYVRFGPSCDAPVDVVTETSTRGGGADLKARPVVVCMQGTNSGAHLSLGEVRMPADVYKVAAGSALALQAARLGFVAVSFERACFGERRARSLVEWGGSPTKDIAFNLLTVGRTLLGQTVAELEGLRQLIGALGYGKRVYLAGYSAAGTASVAAAAASDKFSGVAVGGCIGMMRETVLSRAADGYSNVPNMLNWFESDALLALVAPRTCLVVAGKSDHIWPFSAAQSVVKSASRAWKAHAADGHLRLVEAPDGHTYYPDLFWPAFVDLVGGLETDYLT